MKTYQECIKEYDDRIPHRADVYMLGFLDAIAFIFGKDRMQVVKDTQECRSERVYEEEEN
ncbi:MAG: hypothetical protein ACLP7P_12510 [Rhodomicrobium sp.]